MTKNVVTTSKSSDAAYAAKEVTGETGVIVFSYKDGGRVQDRTYMTHDQKSEWVARAFRSAQPAPSPL